MAMTAESLWNEITNTDERIQEAKELRTWQSQAARLGEVIIVCGGHMTGKTKFVQNTLSASTKSKTSSPSLFIVVSAIEAIRTGKSLVDLVHEKLKELPSHDEHSKPLLVIDDLSRVLRHSKISTVEYFQDQLKQVKSLGSMVLILTEENDWTILNKNGTDPRIFTDDFTRSNNAASTIALSNGLTMRKLIMLGPLNIKWHNEKITKEINLKDKDVLDWIWHETGGHPFLFVTFLRQAASTDLALLLQVAGHQALKSLNDCSDDPRERALEIILTECRKKLEENDSDWARETADESDWKNPNGKKNYFLAIWYSDLRDAETKDAKKLRDIWQRIYNRENHLPDDKNDMLRLKYLGLVQQDEGKATYWVPGMFGWWLEYYLGWKKRWKKIISIVLENQDEVINKTVHPFLRRIVKWIPGMMIAVVIVELWGPRVLERYETCTCIMLEDQSSLLVLILGLILYYLVLIVLAFIRQNALRGLRRSRRS